MFNSDEFYKQPPSLDTYLKSCSSQQHCRRRRYRSTIGGSDKAGTKHGVCNKVRNCSGSHLHSTSIKINKKPMKNHRSPKAFGGLNHEPFENKNQSPKAFGGQAINLSRTKTKARKLLAGKTDKPVWRTARLEWFRLKWVTSTTLVTLAWVLWKRRSALWATRLRVPRCCC